MTTNQTIDGVQRSTIELSIGGEGLAKAAAIHELRALLDAPAVERKAVLAVKRYDRDSVSGHSDVEIALSEHRIMHHDHGPNLAEALARLAGRVARFHKLQAPSLAAQPQGDGVNWKGVADQQKEIIEQQQNLIASLRAELAESYRIDGKPQGEPVAELQVAFFEGGPKATINWFTPSAFEPGATKLYAEHPAPVAVVLPDRSPKDYAIEHAEYMAQSADKVLAKFQAYGLALLAVDEGGDDGEGELCEAIDSARGDLQESLVDLRSMVYEFRKRSAKSR